MDTGIVSKRGYSEKLTVSTYNKKRLMTECIHSFLEHHSEFRGMKLSQNFMLEKVIDYYLD